MLHAQSFHRVPLTDGWMLQAASPTDAPSMATQVPGTVQHELLRRGLLPDPYYGTNEELVQWVGEQAWTYRLTFDVGDYDDTRAYQLHFAGLDTYASVQLNGQLILQTDNMFRRWDVRIDSLLQPTDNQLIIHFQAPSTVAAPLLGQRPPYDRTAVNDTSEPRFANYVRKAQFHFGWDWGLRLVTTGIWRPVYLESWPQARITEVQLEQEQLTAEEANLSASINLQRHANADYVLQISHATTGEVYAEHQLSPLATSAELRFRIPDPQLWWPAGHGTPHRYPIQISLLANDQLIDQQVYQLGLRTVELVQRPDKHGESFFFRINGRPIFIKGASYIPQDAVLTRITPEQKTKLLQSAHDAHLNLIRVWGGGIYEDEHFYNTCDSLGLMVWQDFMFACAAYPGHDAFIDNIRAEAIDNIKRLRHHPSIITWCGNNEVYMAMDHWGWDKEFDITKAEQKEMDAVYHRIFQDVLPKALAEHDPMRPYSHTTPNSQWWKTEGLGRGTLHYWGVWHGPDDFSGYENKVGRYMNEYGFQSFPSMPTIAAFADSSQWALDSPVMDHHQKSYVGNGLIGKFTEKYGEPADNFADSVEQSQLVQYEGMRRAILSHRLRWGYCMGTTFWQLNDCWPGPSWSAIDYYGRAKVFFKELPNLYAPITITPVQEGKIVELAILVDTPEATDLILRWQRSDPEGTIIASGERSITNPQTGTNYLPTPSDMAPQTKEQVDISLLQNGKLIASCKWNSKHPPLRKPKLNAAEMRQLVD